MLHDGVEVNRFDYCDITPLVFVSSH